MVYRIVRGIFIFEVTRTKSGICFSRQNKESILVLGYLVKWKFGLNIVLVDLIEEEK